MSGQETCPTCNHSGQEVKRVTLEHLLVPERRADVNSSQHFVCTAGDCDTVYFAPESGRIFSKSDLTVRFGLKETDAPHHVCYCFDHTTEQIEDEIRRTGQSTVLDRIKAAMSGPGCRCEVTNPLGACCLRTVQQAVDEAYRIVGRPDQTVHAAADLENCCADDEVAHTTHALPDDEHATHGASSASWAQNDLVAGRSTWSLFWGLPILAFALAGLLSPTPRALVSAAALLWAGAGCLMNAARCGRLHCHFTGPLFVLAAGAVLVDGFTAVTIPGNWILGAVVGGTLLAYLPEWIRANPYIRQTAATPDCCASHAPGDQPMTTSTSDCCESNNDALPKSARPDRTGTLAAGGSVVAAILSSACCWLPLLLIAFGASAAGVAGFFAAYRLYFITVAVTLLGFGFYTVYFRKQQCAPGSACAATNRKLRMFRQTMLWTATTLVTAFMFFPNYVGYVIGAPIASNADVAHLAFDEYHIEGMTCEGCATTLHNELAKLPNVAAVEVDYAKKSAIVRYEPDSPVPADRVIETVKAAGYNATAAAAGSPPSLPTHSGVDTPHQENQK